MGLFKNKGNSVSVSVAEPEKKIEVERGESLEEPKVEKKTISHRRERSDDKLSRGVHSVYFTDDEYLSILEAKAILFRGGCFKRLPTTKGLFLYLLSSVFYNE